LLSTLNHSLHWRSYWPPRLLPAAIMPHKLRRSLSTNSQFAHWGSKFSLILT
jgi:hypothetical protein